MKTSQLSAWIRENHGPLPALPSVVRTKSGVEFDPTADHWSYRDGINDVSVNFTRLMSGTSPVFIHALKLVMIRYAEAYAPTSLNGSFELVRYYVAWNIERKRIVATISVDDIVNFRAFLGAEGEPYLTHLRPILKRWHRMGLQGVETGAIEFLNRLRLKSWPKGEAVRTMDPNEGPFSYLELESLQSALNDAYADGSVSKEDYSLAWLFMLLGQRSTQHAALKVCDVLRELGEGGHVKYFVMMPRAKQGYADPRQQFKKRPLIEQFGELLYAHAQSVKRAFSDRMEDATLAPLFPSPFGTRSSAGYEFHRANDEIGAALTRILKRLEVRSERTGELAHVSPIRFRRTFGTRMAEEGHGELVIAEALDHTDTQNVGVYSGLTPEIIERINSAVAMGMVPIAQAFAGIIVSPSQGDDSARKIIDLRIDSSGAGFGGCGQRSFCGFNAPIACYTCRFFIAWLDGPHEAVLTFLLSERDRLVHSTSKRIAAINDRTIFAVAQVVQDCARMKSAGAAPHQGALDA